MKMRKEFGPSDYAKMLAGLRQAAEQVCREEFNKIVAPAPVQLRLAFMDDKRPELPKETYDAPIGSSSGLALTDHDRDLLRNLKIEIPEAHFTRASSSRREQEFYAESANPGKDFCWVGGWR